LYKKSTIADNIISKVKYTVENLTGLKVKKVNINVQASEYNSGKEVHILSTKNIDGIQFKKHVFIPPNNLENNKES
jgi:uncharacterized alkaline shock family protein YloU